METLLTGENIQVILNPETRILFCRWIGPQQPEAIQQSGNTILVQIRKYKIEKILNDNTEVTGPYLHSSDWIANHWFPELLRAGVKHFAWVLSRNIFAEISALEAMPESEMVRSFRSTQDAMQWLADRKANSHAL